MQGKPGPSEARMPQQMTSYIKAQQHAAIQNICKGPPGSIMSMYMRRMDMLCAESEGRLNRMHINAILHGAALICTADVKRHGGMLHPQVYGPALNGFLSRMLKSLQNMMPNVDCRASSSILWSCAKLQCNPDHLYPGTVDSLGQRFIADMDSAIGQSYSSLLLACADLQLYPCEGQVLQKVMHRLSSTDMSSFAAQAIANIIYSLARLPLLDPSTQLLHMLSDSFLDKMQSRDARDHPNAQELANVMWSLAKLPSATPTVHLLNELCDNFLVKMQSPDAREHPKAQELANFYWALARLPSAEPSTKLLVALSDSFLARMQSHEARKQPNAQELANVMLSLAKLPSAQPSAQLLSQLSDSYLDKMQSQNASERPYAQGVANFFWALAKLPSFQPSAQLLHALCDMFLQQLQSRVSHERPNSQELANVCWALAKLPSAKPSVLLLDALCDCFLERLQSKAAQQPSIQEMVNFAWSLQELKHVPPASLASIMLARMLQLGEQQPLKSQEISNFLLACAELRFAISQEEADVLLSHLLALDLMIVQDLANSAWSLAISGVLQLSTFRQLLHRCLAESANSQPPNAAGMRQLFQSLDWLQPPSDARPRDLQAWADLHAQLQRLGNRPQPQQTEYASAEMHAALEQLGLQHSLGVGVKGYTMTAVVHPSNSSARPVLCSCSPLDCFFNEPFR